MPRALKILGYALLTLVAAVLLAGGFVYWQSSLRLGRIYTVPARPAPARPVGTAALQRGRHFAETRGCSDCHGADYGGTKVTDDPARGRVYGRNLTRGRGGLPADYSDADWERAIRHGVARDGHGLFLMPSADYAHFTAQDMGELIAYLRNLAPVDRDNVPLRIGPLARVQLLAGKIKLAAEEIDHSAAEPAEVVPGVTVAYGRYLVVGCTGCHGPNLAGGKIAFGPPEWPPAANLTPHPTGRLAKWTEADFVTTIRTARRPDGTELDPAMPRTFASLTDTEIKALWAYLQTLPAAELGAR